MPASRKTDDSNVDIEWEDPPTRSTLRSPREAFWAALEAHPGKWAVYKRGAKSSGYGWAPIRSKGYEATTRIRTDGKFDVCARKPEES